MGGKQSRENSSRYSNPSSFNRGYMSTPARSSTSSSYMPSPAHNGSGDIRSGAWSSKYNKIDDDYRSLDQVTTALARAGLESSNLIVGIDFTKSNEWTGARSFNHKSLHQIGDYPNPYEQAISIIGRTLSSFDEDNLIPCFGFGDASTHDKDVFSFYPDHRPCNGFEEALARYKELAPQLRLAGPTSFAPIIEMAIGTVEKSRGQYHVLLIIADGQVTRSVDTDVGHLSPQEQDTVNAIVRASDYPLSIVLVGVGDGPWDMMREFDDNIPARAFDNFQFVNFTEIMSRNIPNSKKETDFALAALMEIPSQYKATLELQLLGRSRGTSWRNALPTPARATQHSNSFNFRQAASPSAPPPQPVHSIQGCPICLGPTKNLAFGCGHQTCESCGSDLSLCPICRRQITQRIKLY